MVKQAYTNKSINAKIQARVEKFRKKKENSIQDVEKMIQDKTLEI